MNRDDLYRQVWSHPMTHVARELGKSDVAVAKLCKKLDVPVPPRGYWAKLRAGQRVSQAPLPSGGPAIEAATDDAPPSDPTKSARGRRPPGAAIGPSQPSATRPAVAIEVECGGMRVQITLSG